MKNLSSLSGVKTEFLLKHEKKKYYSIGHKIPNYGRFSDGTIKYDDNYTHPDTFKIAKDARITAIKEGIPPPDAAKIFMLKELIEFLKAKGVKLRLIILPFHIQYYTAINLYHNNDFVSSENLLKRIATEENVPISGSFNPLTFNLKESQFYDMYHCSKEAILKAALIP